MHHSVHDATLIRAGGLYYLQVEDRYNLRRYDANLSLATIMQYIRDKIDKQILSHILPFQYAEEAMGEAHEFLNAFQMETDGRDRSNEQIARGGHPLVSVGKMGNGGPTDEEESAAADREESTDEEGSTGGRETATTGERGESETNVSYDEQSSDNSDKESLSYAKARTSSASTSLDTPSEGFLSPLIAGDTDTSSVVASSAT